MQEKDNQGRGLETEILAFCCEKLLELGSSTLLQHLICMSLQT
jgi:hypothetical protein